MLYLLLCFLLNTTSLAITIYGLKNDPFFYEANPIIRKILNTNPKMIIPYHITMWIILFFTYKLFKKDKTTYKTFRNILIVLFVFEFIWDSLWNLVLPF